MKKYIIPILFSGLLCSCAESKTNYSEPAAMEKFTSGESIESAGLDYTFTINGNNVDVMRGDEFVQTLECDYPPDNNKLIFEDYDFDGFDDLFISMEHGAMFAPGTYFRYNPETLLYEKWDELNRIGAEMIIIEETSALRQKKYNDSSDYLVEYFDYKWENNRLIPFEHRISETGKTIETYSIDENGNETLSNLAMNSNIYVFTVTENGVEITQNNEIIQTIEGNFLEELSSYNDIGKTPEEFIVIEDYDFDGYDDLFIPTLIGRPNTPGTYYRYNSETGLFEEWDELNEIKLLASTDSDAQTITLNKSGSAVDHESIVYKWDNSVLKPISREIQYYSDQVYIDTFEYDENGNQALVKRERAILDENNNWLGTEEIEIQ